MDSMKALLIYKTNLIDVCQSTDNIIENIKRNLKEIITIHFNKHDKNNTLSTFKEKFEIQNALCNTQNNSLTFLF